MHFNSISNHIGIHLKSPARIRDRVLPSQMQAHSHTHTHVAGLPSWSRFPPGECFLVLGFALLPVSSHCSPGNDPNPTPGPLMSTPLINTGQPTLY